MLNFRNYYSVGDQCGKVVLDSRFATYLFAFPLAAFSDKDIFYITITNVALCVLFRDGLGDLAIRPADLRNFRTQVTSSTILDEFQELQVQQHLMSSLNCEFWALRVPQYSSTIAVMPHFYSAVVRQLSSPEQ